MQSGYAKHAAIGMPEIAPPIPVQKVNANSTTGPVATPNGVAQDAHAPPYLHEIIPVTQEVPANAGGKPLPVDFHTFDL